MLNLRTFENLIFRALLTDDFDSDPNVFVRVFCVNILVVYIIAIYYANTLHLLQ